LHTGGLAAPAIAAGLGAAVTMVHGGAAAAAAVSGLGASAAGTAAITGTFGVVGMSHAGSKTAALVSEVRDLGFWDLSEPVTLDPASELAAEARSSGGGRRAGGSEGGGREGAAGAEQQAQAQQQAKPSSWRSWFGSGARGSQVVGQGQAADSQCQQQAQAQPQQQHASPSKATSSEGGQQSPSTTNTSTSTTTIVPTTTSSSGASSSASSSAPSSPSKPPTGKTGSSRRRSGQPPAYRPLLPVPVNPRKKAGASLALTIGVNGWVSCPGDYAEPWRHLPGGGCDRMALVWERDCLQQLGVALLQFIKNKAVEESGKMVGAGRAALRCAALADADAAGK
jgi:hypothetical protein